MLISIIIPMYNVEKTIERCLRSIQRQTYADFEILLVNDGSRDNTEEICLKYAQCDKRIQYLYKQNGGPASARNYGLKQAKGEYVSFIDADDEVSENYLTHLMLGMPVAELCMTDIVVKAGEEEVKTYKIFFDEACDQEYISKKKFFAGVFKHYEMTCVGNVSGKLFVRDKIEKLYCSFDEDVPYGEELQFVKSYMRDVNSIFVYHEKDYIYYTSQDATSQSSKTYANDCEIRMNMAQNFIQMASEAQIEEIDLLRYYQFFMTYLLGAINNAILLRNSRTQVRELMKNINGSAIFVDYIKFNTKHPNMVVELLRNQRYWLVYMWFVSINEIRRLR